MKPIHFAYLANFGYMLHKVAQTTTIWSITGLSVKGMTPCSILKFLIRSIALSTCILAEAILLVFVTCFLDNGLPVVEGGIFKVHFLSSSKSRTLNPLSAITSSPGSRRSKNPHFWVISLSETLPDHTFETKVNAPDGEIPNKHLTVFLCLYSLHVIRCAVGVLGFSTWNSEQSMTTPGSRIPVKTLRPVNFNKFS